MTKHEPKTIWMGFDIQVESGPIVRPKSIQFWPKSRYEKTQPDEPFFYKTDALVGLALIHLSQELKNPFSSPKMNFSFAAHAWNNLEPHIALFKKAFKRTSALREKNSHPENFEAFDKKLTEIIHHCVANNGVDFSYFEELHTLITKLEEKADRPLLFDWSIQLPKATIEKLHHLHSLLFNLRTLVAMDFNAHIQDVTHESIRVDSISDYLPRAEYVANDALLYYRFLLQKDKMPAETFKTLNQNFASFSHNAFWLVKNTPANVLKSMRSTEMEELLYILQMDWLLGSEAGLLFRVREEIFGLIEGYEEVFWPEVADQPTQPAHVLTVNCQLNEKDSHSSQDAA